MEWDKSESIYMWSSWCHSHPVISYSLKSRMFTFLVPAYPDSTGKKAVKWVSFVDIVIWRVRRRGRSVRRRVRTPITRCCRKRWNVGRSTWWRGCCQGICRLSTKSTPSSWLYVVRTQFLCHCTSIRLSNQLQIAASGWILALQEVERTILIVGYLRLLD